MLNTIFNYITNKYCLWNKEINFFLVLLKPRWAFFDGHCVSYTPDTCAVSQNSWTSKKSCLDSKMTKQIFK